MDIPREPEEILKLADIEPEYAEVSKLPKASRYGVQLLPLGFQEPYNALQSPLRSRALY